MGEETFSIGAGLALGWRGLDERWRPRRDLNPSGPVVL
jgi:hypothetical protein